MNQTPEINRESFEAWLFSQPKERVFDYRNTDGTCVICSFVKETTNAKGVCGGGGFVVTSNGFIPTPAWWESQSVSLTMPDMDTVSAKARDRDGFYSPIITILDLQQAYIAMFGDPNAEIPADATVENPVTAKSL